MRLKVGATTDYQTTCLNCGTSTDLVTQVSRDGDKIAGPEAGDISACMYCGHLAIYTADGVLRELTAEEIVDIAGDPRVVRVNNVRVAILKNAKKKSH